MPLNSSWTACGAGGLGGLGGVAGVRGEERGRVVAPVVRQPEVLQVRLVHVEMDRQELDGGDAQRDQVLDHGRVGHAGVRSLQVLRNIRVQHGLAADVGLVDDGVPPRDARAAVRSPVKVGGHPDAGDEILALVHGPAVGVQQQRLPPSASKSMVGMDSGRASWYGEARKP